VLCQVPASSSAEQVGAGDLELLHDHSLNSSSSVVLRPLPAAAAAAAAGQLVRVVVVVSGPSLLAGDKLVCCCDLVRNKQQELWLKAVWMADRLGSTETLQWLSCSEF